MARIEMCYDYYIKGLEDFDKAQIIDMAGKINAMSDAHMYLTEHHAFDYEQAELLLQFKNPLEIVADKWHERISDLSDMSFDLDRIFDNRNGELDGYELAEADAPAAGQPETGDTDKKTISLLDRRLNEHEFYKAMNKLLPGHSPIALDCWTKYAASLEYGGKQPATETFKDLIAEFAFVKGQYGEETAMQAFHIALECPIETAQIRAAAYHLNDGMDINDVFLGAFEEKLTIPPEVRIKTEADRIVAEFAGLTEPNSPNKTQFMVRLSKDFGFTASS